MVFSVQSLVITYSKCLEEKMWNTLTDSQKKIAILATAIFAIISLSYLIYQYVSRKEIKAEKLNEETAGEKENKKTEPSIIPKEIKAEKLNEEIADEKKIKKTEPSIIPIVGGWGYIDPEKKSCEQLFFMLHSHKEFLNIKETLQAFLEANQRVDITVSIENRNEEVSSKGCCFYRAGYARRLGFTTEFLKNFNRLSALAENNPEKDSDLRILLEQVIAQMKEGLEDIK